MADSHPEFITHPNFIQENGFETNSYLYPIKEKALPSYGLPAMLFGGPMTMAVSTLTRH